MRTIVIILLLTLMPHIAFAKDKDLDITNFWFILTHKEKSSYIIGARDMAEEMCEQFSKADKVDIDRCLFVFSPSVAMIEKHVKDLNDLISYYDEVFIKMNKDIGFSLATLMINAQEKHKALKKIAELEN